MSTKLAALTPCLLMICCPSLGLLAGKGQAADASATPQPAADAGNDSNSVIIIQATKRPEDIQQVPMSVTAYTSLDIEDSTDSQLSDLWQHTANTTQMTDHRNGGLSIRGVGYGPSTSFGGEEKPTRGWSPIGFYVDGVSLEAQRGMSDFGSLYDVDTVELLRGPQGTLYGRGTLGGVVNVRTKDPTWQNEADLLMYGGSYKEYRVDAAGGGPISDTLAFRLAVEKAGGSGYYDNITTGSNKTDANNDISARGKLLWKPNSALSVKATIQVSSLQDSTDDWVPLALIDQRQTVSNNAGYDNGKGMVSALQADYQISPNTLATVVVGFGIANDSVSYDGDRTAQELLTVTGYNNIQDLSVEARIAHTGPDPLTWLVGLYGQQEDFHYSSLSAYTGQLFGGIPYYEAADGGVLSQFYNQDSRVRDLNAAVYGEGTLKLAPKWDLTVGARLGYERDTFDWDQQQTNTNTFPPPTFAPVFVPFMAFHDSESDHAPVFLPKAVLDYHATKDVMAYASVSRGYRPGGFNTGANNQLSAETLYEPEYTWNYEIGLKTQVDRTLTINAAAFYIDWRNQQVPVTEGAPTFDEVIVNAGHSRVFGAELEAELRPLQGLKFWASAGLLRAYYTNYTGTGIDNTSGATFQTDYSGKVFPNIPSYTVAVGGFYQHSSGFFLGSTLSGQGHTYVYAVDGNTDSIDTDSLSNYFLLDAEIGYRASHWSVALMGRNLTNKVYALNEITIPPDGVTSFQSQNYVRVGAPRTVGLEVTANW